MCCDSRSIVIDFCTFVFLSQLQQHQSTSSLPTPLPTASPSTTPLPTASPSTSSLPTPLPQIHRYADIDARIAFCAASMYCVRASMYCLPRGCALCIYSGAICPLLCMLRVYVTVLFCAASMYMYCA